MHLPQKKKKRGRIRKLGLLRELRKEYQKKQPNQEKNLVPGW